MTMKPQQAETTSTRFELSSGEIAAEISGADDAQLVIGIPGLSANLRSFDAVFDHLDPARHRRLAFDPRGRGRSETTPPGTYGWPAHARDVIEIADRLGTDTFDLIGWSMGTWIAMRVCQMAPGRVRRTVLIDGGGLPEESVTVPIYAGLDRLGTVYPSFEEFEDLARSLGMFEPWDRWKALFRYEFEDVDGGIRTRTKKPAPWEDEQFRLRQDPYALWRALTMPVLIVRALQPIVPGYGFVLTESDRDRMLAEIPGARVVEIDTDHYNIGMNDETAKSIAQFLDEAEPDGDGKVA